MLFEYILLNLTLFLGGIIGLKFFEFNINIIFEYAILDILSRSFLFPIYFYSLRKGMYFKKILFYRGLLLVFSIFELFVIKDKGMVVYLIDFFYPITIVFSLLMILLKSKKKETLKNFLIFLGYQIFLILSYAWVGVLLFL